MGQYAQISNYPEWDLGDMNVWMSLTGWVGKKLLASVCKGQVTGCLYSIITKYQSHF